MRPATMRPPDPTPTVLFRLLTAPAALLLVVLLGAGPLPMAQAARAQAPRVAAPRVSAVAVDEPVLYTPTQGSRFWIEGRTPLAPFTCAAEEVGGYGRLERADGTAAALDAEVVVPVRAFDCGLKQMNHDLYGALQGREHPAVRLVLEAVERLGAAEAGWTPLRVTGTLSLAGVVRPVVLRAEGQRTPAGRLRLRGRHALRMTDFGITPPTSPLGLVRADDRITVRFELLAAPRTP